MNRLIVAFVDTVLLLLVGALLTLSESQSVVLAENTVEIEDLTKMDDADVVVRANTTAQIGTDEVDLNNIHADSLAAKLGAYASTRDSALRVMMESKEVPYGALSVVLDALTRAGMGTAILAHNPEEGE